MQGISRRFLFLLPLALLVGCPDSGAPDVQGIWNGNITLNDGTQHPVIAGIFEGGDSFVYVVGSKASDQFQFMTLGPMRSQRDISTVANILGLVSPVICRADACLAEYALGGSAYAERMTLEATTPISVHDDASGAQLHQIFGLELARDQPYTGSDPALSDGVPFPQHDGQWQGYYLTADLAVSLSVKAGGAFTGTDAFGCTLSGGIEQNIPAIVSAGQSPQPEDLFHTVLDGAFDAATGKCTGKLTGVGYLSSTGIGPFQGKTGTYFYMGLSGDQGFPFPTLAYMVELKIQ